MKKYFVCGFILLFAAGCGKTTPPGTTPSPNGTPNSQVQVQQTAPAKQQITNPQEVAAHLEELALRVPRVNAARCVVFGNTAIIGIDVDQELDRAKVGSIKYAVAEALRKDPYGANAIVTADMDLNQRIREIGDHIQAGTPISGFANELAAIIGRIMPQMPQSVVPNQRADETDDPAQNVPQRNL